MAITFLPIQGQQSQINGSNALKQGTVQTEFLFQSVSKFKVFQNLEKKMFLYMFVHSKSTSPFILRNLISSHLSSNSMKSSSMS